MYFNHSVFIFYGNLQKIIKMFQRLYVCFALVLASLNVFGITATVSNIVFYIPDSTNANKLVPYIETNWEIFSNSVHYITNIDKKIISQVKTDIYYLKDTNVIIEDHFIAQSVPRATVFEIQTHRMIDQRRYFITTGKYKLKFVLTDMNDTSNKCTVIDSFSVLPAPEKNIFFSDIELIDTAIPNKVGSIYTKYFYDQIPLCTNFLDTKQRKLNFFTEINYLGTLTSKDYPLYQNVFISKGESQSSFGKFMKTDTIKSFAFPYISGSFLIPALKSGNYFLNISLENKSHKVLASKSLFFQRFNTNIIKEDTIVKSLSDTGLEHLKVIDLNKTFISKYSTEQVMAILRMLLPVSDYSETESIKGFLKQPDELYMRYYIYNYFVAINPESPGKAWKEFSEKVIDVNKQFKSFGKPGYESDRGFIYLRYGEPSEIVTVSNESGALPYEIWQYNTLTMLNKMMVANSVFLFYKATDMSSDYTLLHSTVAGEVVNPSWRNYLYVGSSGGTNVNSRAEQYLGNR